MNERMTGPEVLASLIAGLLPGGIDIPPREGVDVRGPVLGDAGNAYLEVTLDGEAFQVIVREASDA